MNPVVHLPHRVRAYTREWVECARVGPAIFPSFPNGSDLALQMLGDATRVEDA